MNSVNGMEFDLLRHMQLSSVKDDNQLTKEEKQTLVEQRRREIDEAQYIAHRLQDRISRVREQFSVRGRAPKPNSYTHDTDSKYGLFWFGKGKYEDDTLAEKDIQYQHQEQGEQKNDISEADDIPDEERYKVWRPIEAPPRPRGWSSNMSLVPTNKDQHPHLNNGNILLSETAPAAKKKKTILAPPWAEHYNVESNVVRNVENRAKHHHDLFERGILPRGENGIDDILRYARNAQDLVLSLQELRMREDRRQEQHMLKAALDEQLIDKRRRRLAEYEKELVQIYGPSMQHILTDVFHQPLSEQPLIVEDASVDEEKEERDQTKREEVPKRHFRQRVETPEIHAKQSRQAWLTAWEEHKRNLASTSTVNNTDAISNKDGKYHTVGTPSTPSIMHNRPSGTSSWDNNIKMGQYRHTTHQQFRDKPNMKRGETILGLNKSNSTST